MIDSSEKKTHEDFSIPDIRIIIQHIWHAKWILLAGALIGGFAAFSKSSKTIPIYRASATLQIDRSTPQILEGVREVVDMGTQTAGSTREYMETQFELMKSKEIALRALRILGMDTQELLIDIKNIPPSEFNKNSKNFLRLPSPLAKRAAHVAHAFGWNPNQNLDDFIALLESNNGLNLVSGRIQASPIGESRLIKMSTEDRDPVFAAKLANAFAKAYVDFNLDTKIQATSSAIDWLTDQVALLKKKLDDSEVALHEFKKTRNTLSVSMEDRLNIVAQSYTTFNQELMQTRAKKILLEATRTRLKQAQEQNIPLDAYPSIRNSSVVSDLKEQISKAQQDIHELNLKYTEKHPYHISAQEKLTFLKSQLQSEMEKVVYAINEEYTSLVETEKRLSQEIETIKKDAFELNHDEINYDRLVRERDNNNTLYAMVLKRQKESKLSQMLNSNNIRIIAPAETSYSPINKNKPADISTGAFIGILLSSLFIVLKNRLNNKVSSQKHVEMVLELPFLGIIPSFSKDQHSSKKITVPTSKDRYVLENPRSSISEHYKTLRTNISFLEAHRPLKTILITSACPKEGKSTNTSNLAIVFSLTGKRILIIDADMRRPRLHKSFHIKNNLGLSNILAKTCTYEEAIQHTDIPHIDILPCGPTPPNPSELLHLKNTQQLFKDLESKYDYILIDSPPIGAVSDGLLLSSFLDGVILIIDSAHTPIQAALRAKKNLQNARAHVVGVVLNNLDAKSMLTWSYHYGYYGYGKSYSSEHTHEKEKNVA
jgi:succinoglycan biosynthesis transport protein ExoP